MESDVPRSLSHCIQRSKEAVVLIPSPLAGEGAPKGRMRGTSRAWPATPSSGRPGHLLPREKEEEAPPRPCNSTVKRTNSRFQKG